MHRKARALGRDGHTERARRLALRALDLLPPAESASLARVADRVSVLETLAQFASDLANQPEALRRCDDALALLEQVEPSPSRDAWCVAILVHKGESNVGAEVGLRTDREGSWYCAPARPYIISKGHQSAIGALVTPMLLHDWPALRLTHEEGYRGSAALPHPANLQSVPGFYLLDAFRLFGGISALLGSFVDIFLGQRGQKRSGILKRFEEILDHAVAQLPFTDFILQGGDVILWIEERGQSMVRSPDPGSSTHS